MVPVTGFLNLNKLATSPNRPQSRVDAPGALYHIIARGIEDKASGAKAIFFACLFQRDGVRDVVMQYDCN